MPIQLRMTEQERQAVLVESVPAGGICPHFYRPPLTCTSLPLFCNLTARSINSGNLRRHWIDIKTIYMPDGCIFERFTDQIRVYKHSYCYNCGTVNLMTSDRPVTHYCPYCAELPTMAVQSYVAEVNFRLDVLQPAVVNQIITALSSERYVSLRLPNRCPDTW